MNIEELYGQTPVSRHDEILVSGDRLFFDNEEYVITGADQELVLVRSQKVLEQQIAEVKSSLSGA
ncbi:MAG: hypothetical protein V3S51_04615 [Dehalococcoidia bacterium]